MEEEVGQRGQQHGGGVGRLPHQTHVALDIGLGDAADEELRHEGRIGCGCPLAGPVCRGDADLALAEDLGADPLPDAGLLSASASSFSAWNTSTPRSRMTSQKASCSTLALLTHSTSSKSSSSAFEGVSLVCSNPGRWTMTRRSLPTSD